MEHFWRIVVTMTVSSFNYNVSHSLRRVASVVWRMSSGQTSDDYNGWPSAKC